MDNHHELEFVESEKICNKSSCVLDSKNRKLSILDFEDNVYGNGITEIDINRKNNIVNKISGSEINQEKCLDQMEDLSESYKKLENMENESNHGDEEDRKKVDDVVLNIFGPPDDSYESVEEEDKDFVVGDIVWVMMKTKLWWPGFISEPSMKVPKKFIYKDYYLVKLYSNPSSVWASSFEVKEFTRHFDEMIKQDDSRTFNAAIDKAVNEITCHIKKELTCSCFQNPCVPKNLELKSFALSRFQPDKLLNFIKHIAVDVNVSKKIDVTVTKNVVYAFYRSLGHRQLQNHQLSPSRNSTRKRSRIELNSETNETRSIKKGLGKCIYGSSVVDIGKIVNLSVKEMLDDLRWVAVNGSTSKERRYFGSLKRFLSCFRNFAFSKDEGAIDSTKPEKPEVEVDFSNIKPKKKRQKKINLNSESKDSSAVVNEGQFGLDQSTVKKSSVRKKKKLVFSEANRIPDLNSNIFVPSVGSFPIIGQHAMSSAMPFYGGFPSTGHAMSSVGGGVQGTGHAMSSVGGGVHIMPSVGGGVHIMPSVGGSVQSSGHAMPFYGGFPGTGHAMSSVGGIQGNGNAMSSVGGVQSTGHAMSSVGGVQSTGNTMSSVGGVQSTGHTMSSIGGVHGVEYAIMSSVGGFQGLSHAMSSVGGVHTTGHAMSSSIGGVQSTGHVMSSSIGGVHTTGHAMSSSSIGGVHTTGHAMSSSSSIGGIQITGQQQQTTVQGENQGNLTKKEQAFINSGIGWLDSNGNSMTFVQLLNDVEGGGKNSNFFQNNFGSQLFPNQISFVSQGSYPKPIEPNHINFLSHNAIPVASQLKKKRNRKPKSIVVSSPLPDLNGSFQESNPISNSNQQTIIKPPRKSKNNNTLHQQPSQRSLLLPMNGFKPVMLPSPPGFGPPRASPPPDLVFIKQKLEMMKSTMEKAGNSLTPEMKLKLENEIRSFSTKVNSMFGSSSS